ncbi:9790_t:CDS:2, partial [Acaulospora colombiana]
DQQRVLGTPFDVPGQIRRPTPINVPSNSRENEDNTIESEVNVDDNSRSEVIRQFTESETVLSQDNDIIADSLMEKENITANDIGETQSEDFYSNAKKTVQPALQYSSSPRVILSFTSDPNNPVDSQKVNLNVLGNSDNASGADRPPSNDITTENDTVDDYQTESSKTRTSRKTASKRSNPSDNESEPTVEYVEELQKNTTKRRKSSSSVASVTSTATDGSGISSSAKKRKLPKSRKPNNKKRVKPWEDDPEEEIPHDDSVVTIAELCKDIKRGRKSTTFKELELAKYQKAQQRRAKRLKLNNLEEESEKSTQKDLPSSNNDNEELLEDNQQDENFEDDPDENFDENYDYDEEYNEEGGEYENEGDDGNYDQEIIGDLDEKNDSQERNTDEANRENDSDRPILMKRRIFANRGSRFVNNDGQYTVREDPKERRNTFNAEGMEVIEEDKFSHIVNSHSYAKRPRKNERWTNEETELFYKSLSQWGTDFEIIAQKSFHNTKTRGQIKNKYKRERKMNSERVNDALDTRIPINIEELDIQVIEEIGESTTTAVTDSPNENQERNEDQETMVIDDEGQVVDTGDYIEGGGEGEDDDVSRTPSIIGNQGFDTSSSNAEDYYDEDAVESIEMS